MHLSLVALVTGPLTLKRRFLGKNWFSFQKLRFLYFLIHWSDSKCSDEVSCQNYFETQNRGEAVLRKHLRKHLRTFEENQISKIIRRIKCKMTLLKFHQFINFTAPKNTRRDTHKSRKPFFPNWKNPSFSNWKKFFFKKRKIRKKFEIFRKLF